MDIKDGKLLVAVVNRGNCEKVSKFLRDNHFHFQFSYLADGIVGSSIMDILGFGTVHRSVIFCVSHGQSISGIVPALRGMLSQKKAEVSFTVPIADILMPDIKSPAASSAQPGKNMEDSEERNMQQNTHCVVIAVVNQDNSHELVETAKSAGASGGTVITAHRTGTADITSLFGISEEKEIVAILTTTAKKHGIMEVIDKSFGMKSDAHGIVFALPVDDVIGAEML